MPDTNEGMVYICPTPRGEHYKVDKDGNTLPADEPDDPIPLANIKLCKEHKK